MEVNVAAQGTELVDPARIRASRFQPRVPDAYRGKEFEEFKADIAAAGGNVVPVLLRRTSEADASFELVYGHRRTRACEELGLPVRAFLVDSGELGDKQSFCLMERENRGRRELSPYEQAMSFSKVLNEGLFPSKRKLAEELSVSHTWVNRVTRLAELPEAVLGCLASPCDLTLLDGEKLIALSETDPRGLAKRAGEVRKRIREAGQLSYSMVIAALLGKEGVEKKELSGLGGSFGMVWKDRSGNLNVRLTRRFSTPDIMNALLALLPEAIESAAIESQRLASTAPPSSGAGGDTDHG